MYKFQKRGFILILITAAVVAVSVVLFEEWRLSQKVSEARIEEKQAALEEVKVYLDSKGLVAYDETTDDMSKTLEPIMLFLDAFPAPP